jgi:uncharacterized membrane protein YeaQ/YmgE (transglycosylase-associated protein family)
MGLALGVTCGLVGAVVLSLVLRDSFWRKSEHTIVALVLRSICAALGVGLLAVFVVPLMRP